MATCDTPPCHKHPDKNADVFRDIPTASLPFRNRFYTILCSVLAGRTFAWQLSSDIYILTYILRKCAAFLPVNEIQWGIFACKSDDLKPPELYIYIYNQEHRIKNDKSGGIMNNYMSDSVGSWQMRTLTSIATSPSEVWSTHLHSGPTTAPGDDLVI